MPTADDGVPARVWSRARGFASRAYHRLARTNYEREWLVRRNRTRAGEFRCFEPCNRHGADPMLAELADRCGPGSVVYDVGANVGVYALALASAAPDRRVVAFEPSFDAVQRLRRNVRLNDLDERIEIRSYALGDADGTRPFYVSSNPELSAFDPAAARRWGATVDQVTTVRVRRLDSLVLDGDLPKPSVLKVDVEGAAPAVVRGGRETLARHRPTLFVELHDEGVDGDVTGELRAELADSPYEIRERDGYWRCDPV